MRHIDLFTQAIISLMWVAGLHAAFVPSTTNIIINKAFYQRLYMEKLEGVKDTILSSSTTPLQPTPPSPFVGFDPTNSEALVSITKGFIATDFGIQSNLLKDYSTAPKSSSSSNDNMNSLASSSSSALPYYSSSLLSKSFIWVSGNNIADGRSGILTKDEYLAAGRYFNLRNSFPDLEYRAHDFRIVYGENESTEDDDTSLTPEISLSTPIERLNDQGGEITVRFTTRVTGTFRGSPLRLRYSVLEPNGKVMQCPPTSVSITYSTRGDDRGKIIKLVTDVVLDRQIGNTNGLSGVNAAAYTGGVEPSPFLDTPPLVAVSRMLSKPLKPILSGIGDSLLAPFPDSVMIQLAKGVIASDFGLNDPNLLAENFLYLEKLIGPLYKDEYLQKFGEEYYLRDGVPDLDLRLTNFRVDPYDPYRVWVDSSPKGVRTGNIGKRPLPPNVDAMPYQGPPQSISFTFDDDGFCTKFTSAAVLDPLLGNTGGLGGIYGILEATNTPMNALLTRSLNEFLSRVSKSVLSSADVYKLSDGRLVNGGLPPSNRQPLLSSQPTKTTEVALPLPPKMPPVPPTLPTKPFFAAETVEQQERSPTIALPKSDMAKPADIKVRSIGSNKAQELKNAASAARAEASEAKKRAFERKQAVLDQERRLAEEKRKDEEAERKKQALVMTAKAKQQQTKNTSRPSPKAPSPLKSPKKQQSSQPSPAVAKRSPTLTLFDSFSGSTKSVSKSKPKKVIVMKGSEVKRSPTLSLFGSSSEKKKTTKLKYKISKKVKVAKSSIVKSPVNQSRPTISLFGFGGSAEPSSSTIAIKKSTPKVTKTISSTKAPRGVPTISKWKYEQSDNTIAGFISGSTSFKDGTPITTSSIVGDKVESNTVVRTTSGSRYYLGDEDTTKTGGIFSFFSDGSSESKAPAVSVTPTPSKQSSSSNKAAEIKQKKQKADAERKRKLDDEAKAKREAQIKARKEAAAIAKAKREKVATEKARKMEEAKANREALQVKKQSKSQVVKSPTLSLFGTSQPKKKEIPSQVTFSLFGTGNTATKKSTSSSTATRPVKKTVSQKKQSSSGSGTLNLFGGSPSPTTSKQVVEKKQSTPAKGSGTFSLFGGSKGSLSSSTISVKSSKSRGGGLNKKKAIPKKVSAKKSKKDNIPVLNSFTQNSDGSLTGIVSNSKDFRSGTKITTSPIKGKAVAGTVVKTSSGSQYRLE